MGKQNQTFFKAANQSEQKISDLHNPPSLYVPHTYNARAESSWTKAPSSSKMLKEESTVSVYVRMWFFVALTSCLLVLWPSLWRSQLTSIGGCLTTRSAAEALPRAPTTSNFVTQARNPFARSGDPLGKISIFIFYFATKTMTIFLKLGDCIHHGAMETMLVY